MEEIWKPISDCDGYDVSNTGRVRSYRLNSGKIQDTPTRIISPGLTKHGYLKISIRNNKGKAQCFYLHCVVARAFIGDKPPHMQVCHNDGNPLNNRVENLRYDTQFANMLDAINHGVIKRGVEVNTAVLDEHDVIVMRRLHKRLGLGCWRLASLFGVSKAQAQNIVNHKSWKHLE